MEEHGMGLLLSPILEFVLENCNVSFLNLFIYLLEINGVKMLLVSSILLSFKSCNIKATLLPLTILCL